MWGVRTRLVVVGARQRMHPWVGGTRPWLGGTHPRGEDMHLRVADTHLQQDTLQVLEFHTQAHHPPLTACQWVVVCRMRGGLGVPVCILVVALVWCIAEEERWWSTQTRPEEGRRDWEVRCTAAMRLRIVDVIVWAHHTVVEEDMRLEGAVAAVVVVVPGEDTAPDIAAGRAFA